eukprot:970854-Rhodomonas_salina.5
MSGMRYLQVTDEVLLTAWRDKTLAEINEIDEAERSHRERESAYGRGAESSCVRYREEVARTPAPRPPPGEVRYPPTPRRGTDVRGCVVVTHGLRECSGLIYSTAHARATAYARVVVRRSTVLGTWYCTVHGTDAQYWGSSAQPRSSYQLRLQRTPPHPEGPAQDGVS